LETIAVNVPPQPLLVSVGVDGVIGRTAPGHGLLAKLTALTPVPAARAHEIIQTSLLSAPMLDDVVVGRLCEQLVIPRDLFPVSRDPAPFTFFAYSIAALRDISRIAPVVVLANASCIDFDTASLRRGLSPWVSGIFFSCDTGYVTPDAEAFHRITRRYELPPGQAVHIGDDWACDTTGAVSAGLGAIWLSHGRPVPDPPLLEHGAVAVAADLAAAARMLAATARLGSPP
jgi:FMN hydrolase / 5-amino-6-(5-phospho-D-ribitylamino)uracil phosphatase